MNEVMEWAVMVYYPGMEFQKSNTIEQSQGPLLPSQYDLLYSKQHKHVTPKYKLPHSPNLSNQ